MEKSGPTHDGLVVIGADFVNSFAGHTEAAAIYRENLAAIVSNYRHEGKPIFFIPDSNLPVKDAASEIFDLLYDPTSDHVFPWIFSDMTERDIAKIIKKRPGKVTLAFAGSAGNASVLGGARTICKRVTSHYEGHVNSVGVGKIARGVVLEDAVLELNIVDYGPIIHKT